MDKNKKHKYSLNVSVIETQNIKEFAAKTGNVYESISIIAKRADQISAEVREELISKLKEFSSHTDNLEEVHENREQIEISRFYERLPHPSIVATNEFVEDELQVRYPDEEIADEA